jgi:hypothetical protein
LARDCSGAVDDFVRAAQANAVIKDKREGNMVLRTVDFFEGPGLNFRNAGKKIDAEYQLHEALKLVKDCVPKLAAKELFCWRLSGLSRNC